MKNMIKIVKKRYYLDLLNEGSQRGGLGQGDGFELVCGSLGGVLVLVRTMSLDGFGQSHRHHFGQCSTSMKRLSNRNKRKETIITNPKEEQRWSYRISLGIARPGLGQNQHH